MFDDEVIRKQIQGFCLYDTLRVREEGFPLRLTYRQFLEKYVLTNSSLFHVYDLHLKFTDLHIASVCVLFKV